MTAEPATQETTPPPGATLHLGGDAWAHPDLAGTLTPIGDVTPYPGNPRRGDQTQVTASIRDHGLYAGVVAQRTTGHILVGNHRRHALVELGAEQVPVVWVDVDDDRAAAIVVRDNRTSDLATNDTDDLLSLLGGLADDPALLALAGYTGSDLAVLRGLGEEPEGPTYSRLAGGVQYEPTREVPPAAGELVDRRKTDALLADIYATKGLPEEVAAFLTAGAQRHLVFDYANIAEFYAHADADVQALMEASALVIIDFEDAAQHGYVRLSERLGDILDLDTGERKRLDAEKSQPRA